MIFSLEGSKKDLVLVFTYLATRSKKSPHSLIIHPRLPSQKGSPPLSPQGRLWLLHPKLAPHCRHFAESAVHKSRANRGPQVPRRFDKLVTFSPIRQKRCPPQNAELRCDFGLIDLDI